MFWKRIDIQGYLPFTHVGNKRVAVDFVEPCTAILGGNGSGKSSMLRLLNPIPATRTDFVKDGKVVKVLEHAGHVYTLTSDFSNATAPHSFKKDDIELNLSGTTDTQRDLCAEHLGWSNLINDLMSGSIHICSMQKAQRKQLFSSAYPSDLSFVLEYHKKVCSQIRTFANQIKLLQNREGSLVSSLIDENERSRMSEWRATALSIIDRIDKANLLLENEISQLKAKSEYSNDHQIDPEKLRIQLETETHDLKTMLLDPSHTRLVGNDLQAEALRIRYAHVKQEKDFLDDKKNGILKNLSSIRDELDKFTRIKNAPASDKKDELNNELILIDKEMTELQQHPSWKEVPSIQADRINLITDLVPALNEIVASLHGYAGKLIGNEELSKLRSENDSYTFTLNGLITEKVGLDNQLASQRSRKSMMTQNSYPSDCSRVCGLRATLEASIRDIDLRIAEIEARLKDIHETSVKIDAKLKANQSVLQEVSPALPIMKNLYDKLSENYLLDLALNGESFVDCLNNHCGDITNRIVRGIESSKIYHRYKELFDRKESIKNTLIMMESNEKVNLSLEVIDDIINDKQSKLEAGIKELDDVESKIASVAKTEQLVSDAGSHVANMSDLIKKLNDTLNKKIIDNRIEFDKILINEHLNVKNSISTKLREIERTLDEQKRIIDILNTEIKPTLEDLRKQKMDWELMETGLSPTKGLPCIYLVRFMNRLISRANAIISRIWYCDMELAYIDEKETLDFTISVILNKSTTVKDISLCSKGQAEVINLAMLLAICIERGYLNQYPILLDEVDGALTPEHRANLVQLLSDLIDDGTIKQMMLVNHFAMQTALVKSESVCLSSDGILIPNEVNLHATIE